MLRLIAILLFLLVVGAGGVMLARYDFPITAQFQDSQIDTSAARITIIFIFALTIIYGVLKLLFWLKNSPKRMLARIRREHEEQGLRNIMLGFSALAAGNPAKAHKFADKAQKALPKQPLVRLLQAQVAVVEGDKSKAAEHYKALTENEDGQFIGYRGLISQAMTNNEPQKALKIADDLLIANPKSAWLNEALIDLAFRIGDWDKLDRYLKKAEANKALDKKTLHEKLGVYYYVKAGIARDEGRFEDSEWLALRSLKYRPEFLPSVIFLSNAYVENEEYKKSAVLIKKFWAICTHPQLAKNYEASLLGRGIRQKSPRVKKLAATTPDDVESLCFLARVLIEERHSDQAREVISHGLKIRETKNLCTLMGEIDDRVAWQNRAEKAAEDKCWYCKVTGARYNEWQLYSDSGELNTITWGYPPDSVKTLLANDRFLLGV